MSAIDETKQITEITEINEITENSEINENSKISKLNWRDVFASHLLLNAKAEIDEYKAFVKLNSMDLKSYPAKLLPRKINIIMAPTNAGKSTMLQSIAIECAMKGPTLFLSMEQEEIEMKAQIYTKVDNLDNADVISGFLTCQPAEAKSTIFNNMLVRKIPTRDFEEFIETVDYMLSLGIEYLIVDYLKPSVLNLGDDRSQQVEKLGSALDELIQTTDKGFLITAIQGNTSSMGKTVDEMRDSPGSFTSGGGNITFSADTAVIIGRHGESKNNDQFLNRRQAVITKTRNDGELFAKYDIHYRGQDHVIYLSKVAESISVKSSSSSSVVHKPKKRGEV